MKILVFLAGLALASSALADIHDPPSNDYGPTRKLTRRRLARNSALASAGLSAKLLSVAPKRYSVDPRRLRGVPA